MFLLRTDEIETSKRWFLDAVLARQQHRQDVGQRKQRRDGNGEPGGSQTRFRNPMRSRARGTRFLAMITRRLAGAALNDPRITQTVMRTRRQREHGDQEAQEFLELGGSHWGASFKREERASQGVVEFQRSLKETSAAALQP